MNIVVTGSSGFIGNNLVKFFKTNHNVIGLDKIRGKNTTIKIDCKSIKLNDILNWDEIDFVIDCAARTDLNGKRINDYDDNYVIIDRLTDICDIHDIKLIGFSSMLVNELPLKKKIDFNFYNPSTAYGKSKVKYEKTLKSKSKSYIIVRPTSVWGPGFKEPYKNFFKYVIKGKFFVSDIKIVKTYCYIDNLIEQVKILMSNYKSFEFSCQYFADGNYNIYDWAKLIQSKNNGKSSKILKIPKFFFYMICVFGDILKIFYKKFPLSTFRFKNLNTSNVIDIKYSLYNDQKKKYTTEEGVAKTLIYLNNL